MQASGTRKPKFSTPNLNCVEALVLQHNLTLGLLFYCRTIVPIVAATIETIVRHSTPKSNCVEALVLMLHCLWVYGPRARERTN